VVVVAHRVRSYKRAHAPEMMGFDNGGRAQGALLQGNCCAWMGR